MTNQDLANQPLTISLTPRLDAQGQPLAGFELEVKVGDEVYRHQGKLSDQAAAVLTATAAAAATDGYIMAPRAMNTLQGSLDQWLGAAVKARAESPADGVGDKPAASYESMISRIGDVMDHAAKELIRMETAMLQPGDELVGPPKVGQIWQLEEAEGWEMYESGMRCEIDMVQGDFVGFKASENGPDGAHINTFLRSKLQPIQDRGSWRWISDAPTP